jgi:type IV pilus assembly protein PilE
LKIVGEYESARIRSMRNAERDANGASRGPVFPTPYSSVNSVFTVQGTLDFGDGAHRYRTRSRFLAPAAPNLQKGLTLIEVMIVVVIVAILALIAYPSYEAHLRKGYRAAAQTFLMEVADRQQRYLLDARSYALGAGALGALSMSVPEEVSKFYTLTVDPAAPSIPPSFTVTATPIAGTRQVADGALTLDHQGAKMRNGQPGW